MLWIEIMRGSHDLLGILEFLSMLKWIIPPWWQIVSVLKFLKLCTFCPNINNVEASHRVAQ